MLFQQTILRYFVHFGQHEKAARQSPAGSLCFIVLFPCYFRVLCVRFLLNMNEREQHALRRHPLGQRRVRTAPA